MVQNRIEVPNKTSKEKFTVGEVKRAGAFHRTLCNQHDGPPYLQFDLFSPDLIVSIHRGREDNATKAPTNHKSQVIGEIVVFTILLLMLVTCYGWFCLKPSPYDVTKNSEELKPMKTTDA